ncbi:MAG TPA: aminotransferase class III-fold pyridoxal phosphate-dependent enzyme, partial [Bacillota bacterium]|nr:aminotransferase class III-fold pyridoxal phosphate-dependent enzyme [Bacillota bacterium]
MSLAEQAIPGQERGADLTHEITNLYEQNVNPALTRLLRFMGLGIVEQESMGCYIYCDQGQQFLDCLGGYGVFNLGHRHPKVVAAVKEQLDKMPMSGKVLLSEPQARLASRLAALTPGDLQYSFFCNSGTEAVEGALKLARLATGRSKIISTVNAFHGKTLGALSATGREVFRKPCEPLLPDFVHVPFGDADAAAALCDEHTAAVIVEPIQGEGGIVLPPHNYLAKLRRICDENGALLILDEVQTGMGRTGKLFACEHYGVVPDIMTLAKALGGGVMPIGAIIASARVWQVFNDNPFIHTSTFGGSPLACAAGLATLEVLEEERLVEGAKFRGEYLLSALEDLKGRFPEVIREVRGLGLLIGLELTEEGMGGFLMAELFDAGILVAYTLNNPKVIRIEPPLIISQTEIDRVISVLEIALEKARESV